jgi:hypothetical protein
MMRRHPFWYSAAERLRLSTCQNRSVLLILANSFEKVGVRGEPLPITEGKRPYVRAGVFERDVNFGAPEIDPSKPFGDLQGFRMRMAHPIVRRSV